MKKLSLLFLISLIAAVFVSCGDDPTGTNTDRTDTMLEKRQFVYNAMNYWYFWQGDVPDLADDRFANKQELNSFLQDFSDAEELYGALQFRADEFSFFIDDYEEYEDKQDGINAALGINYAFFPFGKGNRVAGFIRYIVPDSPAANANLQRLDIFTEVDGTKLTRNNYRDLLGDQSAHDLTLAEINKTPNGAEISETKTVSLSSEQVVENPVFYSDVIDTTGTKIGYLMYNAFRTKFHKDLNDVFGNFKSKNIDNLVLDLRYNGGGAVLSSQLLSSMISGLSSSKKFATFSYNQKRSARDESVSFLDTVPLENSEGNIESDDQGNFVNTEAINKLNLDNLYVLMSTGTASASEALINSLKPYIDVTVIGTQTVGKDQGSLTLYDAPEPYLDKEKANSDHKKAIQPIVLKIVNSNGQDYPDGFKAEGYNPNLDVDGDGKSDGGCPQDNTDNCIDEININNLQNKPAIGSPQEPLLAKAIELILGQPAPKATDYKSERVVGKMMLGNKDLHRTGNGMYLLPGQAQSLFGN